MPTNDTQTDGIEKLRKLHSVLAEDSVYEKAVPKDFNEFVKKYSDPTKLSKLHSVLIADEVYAKAVPADINEAATKYGLGKPSVNPPSASGLTSQQNGGAIPPAQVNPSEESPSLDGRSTLQGKAAQAFNVGVEGKGRFPQGLTSVDIENIKEQLPGGELIDVNAEAVSQGIANKSPRQVKIESINAIKDTEQRKIEQAKFWRDIAREKSAENRQIEGNLSQLQQGIGQVEQEAQALQQQLQDPNLDPQTAQQLAQQLEQTQANYNSMVGDYNSQLDLAKENTRIAKTMALGAQADVGSRNAVLNGADAFLPMKKSLTGLYGASAWNAVVPSALKTIGAVLESPILGATILAGSAPSKEAADAMFNIADAASVETGKYNPESAKSIIDDVNAENLSVILGSLTGSIATTFAGGNASGAIGAQLVGAGQVYGDVYKQGRDAGLNEYEATLFAAPTAAVAGYFGDKGVERLSGMFTKTGTKAAIREGLKELGEKPTEQALIEFGKKFLFNTLKGASAEGTQEAAETATEFGSKLLAEETGLAKFNQDLSLDAFQKSLKESFAAGAIGGGLLGGFLGGAKNSAYADLVTKASRNPQAEKDFMDAIADGVLSGDITYEQREQMLADFDEAKSAAAQIPPDIKNEKAQARSTELILEQQKTAKEIESVNPAMAAPLEAKLKDINAELGAIAADESSKVETPTEATTINQPNTTSNEGQNGNRSEANGSQESAAEAENGNGKENASQNEEVSQGAEQAPNLPTKVFHATTAAFEGLPKKGVEAKTAAFNEPSGVYYSTSEEGAKQATGKTEGQRIVEAEFTPKNPLVIEDALTDENYNAAYEAAQNQVREELGDEEYQIREEAEDVELGQKVSEAFSKILIDQGYDSVVNKGNGDVIVLDESVVAEPTKGETKQTEPIKTQSKFFKKKPQSRDTIIVDIDKVKTEKPNAFEFLRKYKGHENFEAKDIRNALAIAYSKMMTYKAGAENLYEQISELEDILEGTEQIRKTTKSDFKKQAKESGDFTSDQLKIFDSLVDSLDTEYMPEYDSFESSLAFVGIDPKKTPNFYVFTDNILSAKDPASFIHEVGHFAFFNVLSKEDRLKYVKYMIDSSYGKEGKSLKERLAMTSEKVETDIDGNKMEFSTNVGDNFSEYFAEQFRQWYLGEKVTPKEFDSIFEKVSVYLSKLIAKLKKGDFVDKNLIEFFEKISPSKPKAEVKTEVVEKKPAKKELTPEQVKRQDLRALMEDIADWNGMGKKWKQSNPAALRYSEISKKAKEHGLSLSRTMTSSKGASIKATDAKGNEVKLAAIKKLADEGKTFWSNDKYSAQEGDGKLEFYDNNGDQIDARSKEYGEAYNAYVKANAKAFSGGKEPIDIDAVFENASDEFSAMNDFADKVISSGNAFDIAANFGLIKQVDENNSSEDNINPDWQVAQAVGSISESDFNKYFDKNWLPKNSTWVRKGDTKLSLDTQVQELIGLPEMAQSLGNLDEQDAINKIGEIIQSYPNGANSVPKGAETNYVKRAQEKFREITGVDLNDRTAAEFTALEAELGQGNLDAEAYWNDLTDEQKQELTDEQDTTFSEGERGNRTTKQTPSELSSIQGISGDVSAKAQEIIAAMDAVYDSKGQNFKAKKTKLETTYGDEAKKAIDINRNFEKYYEAMRKLGAIIDKEC